MLIWLGGRPFPPPLPIHTEQDSSTAKPLNKGHLGGVESAFIQSRLMYWCGAEPIRYRRCSLIRGSFFTVYNTGCAT